MYKYLMGGSAVSITIHFLVTLCFPPLPKENLKKTHLEILILSFRTTETTSHVIVFIQCLVVFAVCVHVDCVKEDQHCWASVEVYNGRISQGKGIYPQGESFST